MALLQEWEAAKVLGVAPATLAVWRSTGRYNLPFVKIGRKVRYRQSDLDAWIKSRVR
jgi:excisionase family DNA binding protein